MWDLWWTKWRWGRFSPSTSVFLANFYSINFSIITITYHLGLVQLASSGRSTNRLRLTPLRIKKVIIIIIIDVHPFVGPWLLFQFFDPYTQSVRLLEWGISPS
jgi:hypothetical protein